MIIYDKESSNKIYNNDKFKELQGLLSDKEAKITLAEFLYNNLGVTTFLLTGIRLFPFQEIILRSWFDHNFNMNVWGRGCSKSYLVSIFCCLYPLFNPECKIILASNVFRSTRRLIVQIEKIINGKNAKLLSQCFPRADGELKINRRSDEWHLGVLNGAFIRALPLNDKIRGERADVLIIDEFLLVGEEIYKSTLLPFLASKTNISEQLKIQEQENAMVLSGDLTKEQRTILGSNKKIIGLTSASYDFEFVAQLYKEWVNNITNPLLKAEIGKKFFVSRLSYKATPPELIDEEISEIAKSGGEETSSFKREFMAQFSSSSDSFFNIRKLHQYTVKAGDLPCVQLKSNNPESKYIVAIDPNFNAASTSDLFGIGTYLLNDETRTITLVNSYGAPGGNLSDHLAYLYYVLTHFNVVFVVADLAGSGEGNNFISAANQSNLFMKNNLKLSFIEGDFDADDYANQLTLTRNSYNLSNKRIVYRQIYGSQWIRRANEALQNSIDTGKVWFASGLSNNDIYLDQTLKDFSEKMPVSCKDLDGKELNLLDFIALQDDLINDTKNQLALIEPRATSSGALQFDLPIHLKRLRGSSRPRRDLYSIMVMANWSAKCYWDFMYNAPVKKKCSTFSPRLIR